MRRKFSPDQLLILGVSMDKMPQALYHFMEEKGFNYPVFTADDRFGNTMGVSSIPQLLIYSKAGKLAINHRGLVDQAELDKALQKLIAE